ITIGLITAFMGYKARNIEMIYDFAKVVPATDPDMMYFQEFKEIFGEDGNVFVIGLKDSSIYEPQNFLRLKFLQDEISSLKGVSSVLSLPGMVKLDKDAAKRKFNLVPVFETIPDDQKTLDSLLQVAADQRFYNGQLLNESNGATLLLVSIENEILNSENRQVLMSDILHSTDLFTEVTGITLHHAGLPYVRSELSTKVKEELNFFLILSGIVTALILLFFFRSWNAVLFPMIVIGVMV